jgi:hypothetical protein
MVATPAAAMGPRVAIGDRLGFVPAVLSCYCRSESDDATVMLIKQIDRSRLFSRDRIAGECPG